MLYAIIYELNNKTKDYSGLHTRIQEFGIWMHYVETLWIIESTDSAESIYDVLFPFIDKESDNILVLELGDSRHGWMDQKGWEWLEERGH